MTNLRELHLGNNLLTGTIPDSLSSLDLEVLRVQDNYLTGQVLGLIDSWPNMKHFDIERTLITGTIPESIGTLGRLEKLFLGPHLNGTLPASFSDLTSLVELKLTGITLSGSIPSDFGRLTSLGRFFYLFLSMSIPNACVVLTNIHAFPLACAERFMFDRTKLEGPIPTSLGELTAMTDLMIINSRMTGTIPTELGLLSRLTTLSLVSISCPRNVPLYSLVHNTTALRIFTF